MTKRQTKAKTKTPQIKAHRNAMKKMTKSTAKNKTNRDGTKTHYGAKKKMSTSTAKNKTNRDGSVNARKLVKNSPSKKPTNLKLPANALKRKAKKKK